MFNKIIDFSIKNKFVVAFFTLTIILAGIWSMKNINIDAVPDITNNQVQIVTVSPTLAPQEIEQFITYPVEVAMSNLPYTEEIRSISRYGLSVVTVVFEEDLPILKARQFIAEQIAEAKSEIPENMGEPTMMPITTGLGEVYQYYLLVDKEFKDKYSLQDLRSIQDWIVKRQLSETEGIIETGSYGGKVKEIEISVDPVKLKNTNSTLLMVNKAIEDNNANTGASYLQKNSNSYYIRTQGLVKSKEDIESIVISNSFGVPVLVKDIATLEVGYSPRYGAMTANGEGEVVGGITLMFKGENANKTIENVKERVQQIQKSLPPGVNIEPFLDRSELVNRSMNTVKTNLIEGALIVVFILIVLLGNYRAGLIVASVIPLSLLFAFCLMKIFGVSANLMSLGAVDFGLVLDGSIIVVEAALHRIYKGKRRTLLQSDMDLEVYQSSSKIRKSAAFGEIIILIVYLPILALVGIEGKMFAPMAQTVSFAILGALLLSMTYVPMMLSVFLKKNYVPKLTLADKIMGFFAKIYKPVLNFSLKNSKTILATTLLAFLISVFGFLKMGGEFIPTLEEGDLALQISMKPGTSLKQAVRTTSQIESVLQSNFPEVKEVVSKIGTSEVPTDPMGIENADIVIGMKPKKEWISADSRVSMQTKMKAVLESKIVGVNIEMTQPIQLRFNELISGTKADVAVKIFGEDLNELALKGEKAKSLIQSVNGIGDINLEQVSGLPQLMIDYKRDQISRYGVNIKDLNTIIKTAYAGENVGVFYEGEKKFGIVVRLNEKYRQEIHLDNLFIENSKGEQIKVSELVKISIQDGPNQISRENTQRKIVLGLNVRDRDIQSLVEEVDAILTENLNLKPGYFIQYGGNFENLQKAKDRLSFALPIALFAIIFLLFFTFGKIRFAILIFTTVPMSAIGGVAALYLRDMPFSISAGIGFIALFGVAVLDGIVLISTFRNLQIDEPQVSLLERIKKGSMMRLRPVLVTSIVASFGFLPMALSNQAGAEVQKPLATVVIGGLISATILTLVVIPIIYFFFGESKKSMKMKNTIPVTILLLLFGINYEANSQELLTRNKAIDLAINNSILIKKQESKLKESAIEFNKRLPLGSTNFQMNFGELDNPNQQGHQISVSQNFGNIIQYFTKTKWLNNQNETAKLNLDKQKLETELYIKNLYAKWQAILNLNQLNKQQVDYLSILEKESEKQFKIGVISRLDYMLVHQKFEESKQVFLNSNREFLSIQNEIKSFLGINREVKPEPLIFDNKFIVTDNLVLKESFKDWLVAKEKTATLKSQTEKVNWLPELALGYTNKKLIYTERMNSFTVGLNFNLLNSQTSINKQKAVIENKLVTDQVKFQEISFKNKLDELKEIYRNYSKFPLAKKFSKAEQKTFLKELKMSLQNGELNIYRFVDQLDGYLNLEKNKISVQLEKQIIEHTLTTIYN